MFNDSITEDTQTLPEVEDSIGIKGSNIVPNEGNGEQSDMVFPNEGNSKEESDIVPDKGNEGEDTLTQDCPENIYEEEDEVENINSPEDVGLDGDLGREKETDICQSQNIPDVPFQPILEKYAPINYGKYTRDFFPLWYKTYPWLQFNVESKTAECYCCKYFSVKSSMWTFNKWKQTERLKHHSENKEHKFSYMKWMDYKLSSSSQTSVLSQIGSHHSQNVEENREYLRKLIEAISFLGKQNIPFRGHREDRSDLCNSSDQNRGNFLELISSLSKDNVTVNKKTVCITL